MSKNGRATDLTEDASHDAGRVFRMGLSAGRPIRIRRRRNYRNVVAVCGQPQFADTRPKTLLNPQILIEVLSTSTGDIDFIDKMEEYFQIDSVTDYLIAAQTRMWVAHYTRRNSKDWNTRIYHAPADIMTIESLDLTLSLAAVYRKIVFPEPETRENETA